MRNILLIGSLAALASCTFAVRGVSQDMGATNLGDYMGKQAFAPRFPQDEQTRKLVALYDQGVAEYQHKQYDNAIASFTAILQTNPESRVAAVVYVARAQALVAKKDFKKALADTTEAIRLDRRLPAAYNTRGVAYGSTGDFSRAVNDFQNAVRLDQRFSDAQRNLELARRYQKQQSANRHAK